MRLKARLGMKNTSSINIKVYYHTNIVDSCIPFRNGLLYIHPNKSWIKDYTAEQEKWIITNKLRNEKERRECNSTISSEINWSWKNKEMIIRWEKWQKIRFKWILIKQAISNADAEIHSQIYIANIFRPSKTTRG